jgi:hypothetical protein
MKRLGFAVLLWCLSLLQASALTLKQNLGSSTTLLSVTELGSLGANGYATGTVVFDNAVGQAGDGALRCRLELFVTFAAAPTANTAMVVWLLRSYDNGATYEPTPTATVSPGSALAMTFPVNSGTGQVITRGILDIDCPPGKMKAVLKNDNTGQAFTSGSHTLKIAPIVFTGN